MSLALVKELREKTGAGVVDAKKAFDEANGDMEKALDILRKRGQAKALKKTDRETKEGVIAMYLHPNKKVGSMVKLFCETEFVGRNEEFQDLAKDIAMHVAALGPKVLRAEDVASEVIEKEKAIWIEQLQAEKKPENMFETIMAGKEKKFREDMALLSQPFVKDPNKTVQDLIAEAVGKMGENIVVGDFVRYEL
ncbi:MAG: translation elongation factor Ts [Candidatus Moranbacteria bacterium]|nr:translation elongation factor Ts [Candidatus Moranbacteria bacterium]